MEHSVKIQDVRESEETAAVTDSVTVLRTTVFVIMVGQEMAANCLTVQEIQIAQIEVTY